MDSSRASRTAALVSSSLVVIGGSAFGQMFSYSQGAAQVPQGNPNNNSRTENVDFGDVDGDGDWDAIFADGGDQGNDQNRIWINQGGLQGGTVGFFLDETATRCPPVLDQSRDIELVDFDGDGDLDVQVSNTSSITPQSNRFWTNLGGAQGGTEGFFLDETSTRWVGVGGPGSSVAPSLVLGGGGFRDFSCDSDFADLDNDGDEDYVHASYGATFGGQVPTRIFLNDGDGFFSEFNPSGFQLSRLNIASGDPGLWCEGAQQANTTNATGASCDIATSALDIDPADTDGDLDLDLLHGARQEVPRLFQNRLEENGGSLGFRDVTGAVFPAGYSIGDGHYAQEMGDLDGDGDLDIFGLNWRANFGAFTDCTLENTGAGVFANRVDLSDSIPADNEGDLPDVDNDGDVDLVVAAFAADNRLYRNNNDGGAGFSFTFIPSNASSGFGTMPENTSLDIEGCDVDEDGDYDVWVANDIFLGGDTGENYFLKNITQVPDTHAPSLFLLEQAPSRVPGPEPTVVRVQVYDNAPYYITWYNPTELVVTVGDDTFLYPMRSSMGQIFRGEIPGDLVGTICYKARSSDRYGNTAETAELCYTSEPVVSFCDASDGAHALCPCGNPGLPGAGCDNAQSTGGVQATVTSYDGVAQTGVITGTGFPPAANPTAVLMRGNNQEPTPVVFFDGLRCVGLQGFVRLAATTASGGTSVHTLNHGAGPGTFYYQIMYRNTPATFCSSVAANTSNGQAITW